MNSQQQQQPTPDEPLRSSFTTAANAVARMFVEASNLSKSSFLDGQRDAYLDVLQFCVSNSVNGQISQIALQRFVKERIEKRGGGGGGGGGGGVKQQVQQGGGGGGAMNVVDSNGLASGIEHLQVASNNNGNVSGNSVDGSRRVGGGNVMDDLDNDADDEGDVHRNNNSSSNSNSRFPRSAAAANSGGGGNTNVPVASSPSSSVFTFSGRSPPNNNNNNIGNIFTFGSSNNNVPSFVFSSSMNSNNNNNIFSAFSPSRVLFPHNNQNINPNIANGNIFNNNNNSMGFNNQSLTSSSSSSSSSNDLNGCFDDVRKRNSEQLASLFDSLAVLSLPASKRSRWGGVQGGEELGGEGGEDRGLAASSPPLQ